MRPRLIVSVHDVTPRHADRLAEIDGLLGRHGLRGRYAMLVVPDFWRQWPLEAHPGFCGWLRDRAAEGVEMTLHGFTHRDESTHTSWTARWRATVMTAREGEFLGLDAADAAVRIRQGRALVSRIVGRPIDAFVAPAWLYGEGALRALREVGFAIAEDHVRVWSPASGRTLARGPVLSYASRSPGRVAASLAWSRLATRVLRRLAVVRFAIHPHDLDVPRLAAEIERALSVLLAERDPMRYADLL